MASSAPPQSTSKQRVAPQKLPRLPKHARIQKRPILRPPIPSPYANSSKQKVVYISTHTPFIPAVKRVRSLLEESEKRAVGPLNLLQGKGSDRQRLRKLTESLERAKSREGGGGAGEEVVLKATGRAIERALSFALYFQGQPDCLVRIRTAGVGVVDDIVVDDADDDAIEEEDRGGDGAEQGGDEQEEEPLPETRVRRTSVLEVAVTLK